MNIQVVAIGDSMPQWVIEGTATYVKRLPKNFQLEFLSVTAKKRPKNAPIEKILNEEGLALLKKVPKGHKIIALDRPGKALSTVSLAAKLGRFHDESQHISILIGGPEGLSKACLDAAEETWSLSALTLPHPLVRVLIAEQCYRAWSLLSNHPYHR